MKRAASIFLFEGREGDPAFTEKIWRTRSVPLEAFVSVATPQWEMVVTRQDGRTDLTVRGPETRASAAAIPQNAEFFGIQFRLGTFMPTLPPGQLVDDALTLPRASSTSFWLNGSAWDFPSYDNADVFVDRLIREGLIVCDHVVVAALNGEQPRLTPRSVQRRVLRATGLTQGSIRQMQRAKEAAELLDNGASILETIRRAGYADQSHLTRSLRRFVGQTPGGIADERG